MKTEKIQNSFSGSAAPYVKMASMMASVNLKDRTVEAGHYDRAAYETDQDGWDKIHTIMTAAHSVASGTEKRVLSAAISRIRTSASIAAEKAKRDAWLALSDEEREARREARREERRQRLQVWREAQLAKRRV